MSLYLEYCRCSYLKNLRFRLQLIAHHSEQVIEIIRRSHAKQIKDKENKKKNFLTDGFGELLFLEYSKICDGLLECHESQVNLCFGGLNPLIPNNVSNLFHSGMEGAIDPY